MIYQEINEEMLTALPLAPVHLLNQWWIIDKKFSIPFFDMLPEAKSFATVPIGPAYLGHSDWQKYHIEQWDLNMTTGIDRYRSAIGDCPRGHFG